MAFWNAKREFPQTMYVRGRERTASLPTAHGDLELMSDKETVGVYQFVGIKQVSVTRELEDK